MNLENEAMQNFAKEKVFEKEMVKEFTEAAEAAPADPAAENLISIDFSFLMKKTGPGQIEAYIDHPMNPKRSKGRARFLRGCTGMAGDLDLAIIDIVLGAFEMIMEKRSGNGTAETDQ